MPSKVFDTTWPAEAHTLAKIDILKAYLNAWFPILGRSKGGQPVLFIDGFAGPGEYTNHGEGSPVAALAAAQAAVSTAGPQWIASDIHCVFIEEDEDRYENLKARLSNVAVGPRVKPHVLRATFVEGLAKVRSAMPRSFERPYPLFVFIDPFGATGVPFTMVADILRSPCSEVLINLDADGIARILKAKAHANHEAVLGDVFGDSTWATSLDEGQPFGDLCRQVLDHYMAKLWAVPGVKYVFPFEMRGRKDALNYYLVFASRHPLGLEKMKEAMRAIAQGDTYCFSDAHVGQHTIFNFENMDKVAAETFGDKMLSEFRVREVQYPEMRDYALNRTPFTNPKAMLRYLEGRGVLAVKSRDPKRRKGTFKEETLISVTFTPEAGHG